MPGLTARHRNYLRNCEEAQIKAQTFIWAFCSFLYLIPVPAYWLATPVTVITIILAITVVAVIPMIPAVIVVSPVIIVPVVTSAAIGADNYRYSWTVAINPCIMLVILAIVIVPIVLIIITIIAIVLIVLVSSFHIPG